MARFTLLLLSTIALLPAASPQEIRVSPGTKIELALTRPIWARTAKTGDPLYAQTVFPLTLENQIAIPAGTYLESRIASLTTPTRRSRHAEVEITSTKLIFANGYTVLLPSSNSEGRASVKATQADTAPQGDQTITKLDVQVSTANDLLLDNGAQFEIALAWPLALDPKQTSAAGALSRAPLPGQFKSATLCRPTQGFPGTPGSPETVIPGNPGTPSTTIPGGPGQPDITIPGTPATPSTVITGAPATPGTPGTVCPSPPLVISSTPVSARALTSSTTSP